MAEGIKIRSLDTTNSLVDSDVLIIDNVTADDLTTAVTKQIRYDDFIADLTGRDLVFSGQVIFNANISFTGDIELSLKQLTDVTLTEVKTNDVLVYDGDKWVNGEAAGGVGEYLALETGTGATAEENIVHINVTVGNKVNHRDLGNGSNRCFYLDGKEAPFLILTPGRTYMFHQDDNTNAINNQHRLKIYASRDKGFTSIGEIGFVEYSNEEPGNEGCYTKLIMKNDYQYIQVYYQAEGEEYMGNGIFNPDGSEIFSIGPYVDSLQTQINSINEQLKDLIEIEQG